MPAPRRRLLWFLLLPVVLVAAFVTIRARRDTPRYATVAVDRGDVADVVGATGLLQAVITVQVGSQVSGTIEHLYADFNSTVKKDQVIARLEQSLFLARLNQATANLASARAQVERSQAAIDDAKQKYERSKELAAKDLVPPSDLESARATYEGAVAQNSADKAAVKQAEAAQNQAQVDLDHTVITAPVDGVVLARNVDIGQTVAASFTAPVLFVIANDLTHMEVNASIDEADIGRVRTGQDVTFGVDAFPDDVFHGRVEQVRLQPVTTNNVVTYNTIITVDNESLRLMPGMTATVSVVVRKSSNVLRIPAAALRFRPEGYEDATRGARPAGAPGGTGAAPAAASLGPGARPGGGGPGGPGGAGAWRRRADGGAAATGSSGPTGRPGLVFVLGPGDAAKPNPVKLGLSDGRYIEVVEGLEEGAKVVTGFDDGRSPRPQPTASGTNNPFQPGRFQPRTR
ncbi:MAG TPA: efflux RND transporter periplasmic adaptor subunit [Vicinamibacteria bacterium]|nr:efflux RND transporter periplasmic adaptor subunit [Vicinamibacteria bacterium]